ncbi:hypothetical protein [Pseudomonas sp. TH04]|nr:hypothetical protein [Pseudomonas sp. TH04]
MNMFGFLADKAKALSEAVSETAISAKDAVLNSVGEGASAATEYLEKNWPQIERVVVDGLLTVTHDRIKDDEAFLLVAEKAFELLPAPVRLLLPRSAFLAHTEKHRVSIVELLEEKRQQRLALEAPAAVVTEVIPAS